MPYHMSPLQLAVYHPPNVSIFSFLAFGNPINDATQTCSGCEVRWWSSWPWCVIANGKCWCWNLYEITINLRASCCHHLPLHTDATLRIRMRGEVAAQRLCRSRRGKTKRQQSTFCRKMTANK